MFTPLGPVVITVGVVIDPELVHKNYTNPELFETKQHIRHLLFQPLGLFLCPIILA